MFGLFVVVCSCFVNVWFVVVCVVLVCGVEMLFVVFCVCVCNVVLLYVCCWLLVVLWFVFCVECGFVLFVCFVRVCLLLCDFLVCFGLFILLLLFLFGVVFSLCV